MTQSKYPLEQVLEVKKDRVEKAERVVKEKQRALQTEEEKLKKIEESRDKVLKHYNAKLSQLRQALDQGTTSEEVLQMKAYLKVVAEQLKAEEEKVKVQKKQVEEAQRQLDAARQDWNKKRVDEEKMHMHKIEWEKEMYSEELKKEAKEQDELGQVVHEGRRQKNKESST